MVGTIEQVIQYLFKQDKTKKYEVKEYKKKRSLNANNYFWELTTQLADVLRKIIYKIKCGGGIGKRKFGACF